MTGAPPLEPSDEERPEPLLRPFLSTSPGMASTLPEPIDNSAGGVRPYFLTSGRTDVLDKSIGFETVVLVTERGNRRVDRLAFELRRIIARAADPVSVAELAVELNVPIGVARILTSDLTSSGLLQTHAPMSDPSTDVDLLTRLIAGVRAL